MFTISLCMIVKDEEKTLERCLSSISSIVDEIVIVDTGSTDKTKEVASKFTDKILDFQWIDDFSAARNFSFEQATMDYILWLDADDIILPKDIDKFRSLIESMPPETDIVMMKYNTGFDLQGNVTFSYFRERLVKRSRCFKWQEPIHECLELSGRIFNSDVCITHAKEHKDKITRNIQIYENYIAQGKKLSCRGMYYYARELKDNKRYHDAIHWFNLFLESKAGWVEDNITACSELAKCYHKENNPEKELAALLHSFSFDTPRAEICCQLGYYFKLKNKYSQAAFWFKLVLELEKPKNNWGFCLNDCWGFIPCIECAFCYDRLGDYKTASNYNNMAAKYKSDSPAVLYNKKYFDSKLEIK